MLIKKVRKICMVKGCGNKDCYTLTASREFGNSVIICGNCLSKAAALAGSQGAGVNPEEEVLQQAEEKKAAQKKRNTPKTEKAGDKM